MESSLSQLEQTVNELEESQNPDMYNTALKKYQECLVMHQNMEMTGKSKEKSTNMEDFDKSMEACLDANTNLEEVLQLKAQLLQFIDSQLSELESMEPTLKN